MTRKQSLIAIAGVSFPLVAALSLYATAVCSCASVAQAAVAFRWADVDTPTLHAIVEKRYPKGTAETEVAAQVGRTAYPKYCGAADSKSATVCLLPHDRNFWRERSVELTFGWDSARRLRSVVVVPRVQYRWE